MNEYEQQAADFLAKHKVKFTAKLANTKSPSWDKEHGRNHFIVSLSRNGKKVSFDFFGSRNDFEAGIETVSPYTVLACCSSDVHCPETFEDFCAEYGYDEDSRTAEKTFKACLKQAEKLRKIFDDEEILADLTEIA